MEIQSAIGQVMQHRNLAGADMADVMRTIMTGGATPAQIGGFLVAMRMKGETAEELAAAAGVMREMATGVSVRGDHLVDTCGTGGDSAGIFNVSTASAIVAAAAGAQVAKHGNRSVSSKSGSADVLEAAGVRLDLGPEQVGRCIREVGIGFMFAPAHHSAMKHAIGPRRELAARTLFNLLGPLTNPAGVTRQVMGVFDDYWLVPIAEVLKLLGSEHVMVVHSEDGLDEISIAEPTQVAELKDGNVATYRIAPEDFDLGSGPLTQLKVGDAAESLALIESVLEDQPGAARDIVRLNAGAAIYVSGVTDSLADGVRKASAMLTSGAARDKLRALVELTQRL
jgi:anthranilate phosphoribosyltransferase